MAPRCGGAASSGRRLRQDRLSSILKPRLGAVCAMLESLVVHLAGQSVRHHPVDERFRRKVTVRLHVVVDQIWSGQPGAIATNGANLSPS